DVALDAVEDHGCVVALFAALLGERVDELFGDDPVKEGLHEALFVHADLGFGWVAFSSSSSERATTDFLGRAASSTRGGRATVASRGSTAEARGRADVTASRPGSTAASRRASREVGPTRSCRGTQSTTRGPAAAS